MSWLKSSKRPVITIIQEKIIIRFISLGYSNKYKLKIRDRYIIKPPIKGIGSACNFLSFGKSSNYGLGSFWGIQL